MQKYLLLRLTVFSNIFSQRFGVGSKMPSIAIPASTTPITGASALGVLTFSAADVYPGSWGWLSKTDGSGSPKKVKVLSVSPNSSAATTANVRVFPNNADEYANGQQAGAFYTNQDVSAFATGSALYINIQTVPIDPAFNKRSLP
jgi:hypothetical protein